MALAGGVEAVRAALRCRLVSNSQAVWPMAAEDTAVRGSTWWVGLSRRFGAEPGTDGMRRRPSGIEDRHTSGLASRMEPEEATRRGERGLNAASVALETRRTAAFSGRLFRRSSRSLERRTVTHVAIAAREHRDRSFDRSLHGAVEPAQCSPRTLAPWIHAPSIGGGITWRGNRVPRLVPRKGGCHGCS
jgi:hypothetical protein